MQTGCTFENILEYSGFPMIAINLKLIKSFNKLKHYSFSI